MEKIKKWGEPMKYQSDYDRASQWEREVFAFDSKGRRVKRSRLGYDFWENLLILIFTMLAMTAMFVAGLWIGKFLWGC